MLKKLKDTLNDIERSKEFKKYKKENKDSYLTSALLVIEVDSEKSCILDFYSTKKHRITEFKFFGKSCERSLESKILQKEKSVLEELELNDVKVEVEKAFEKASEFLQDEADTNPKKLIVVLQKLGGIVMWNLTYFTSSLNILNVKINAKEDLLISHEKV